MKKLFYVLRRVGSVLLGVSIGLLLGSYLVQRHQWHHMSLYALGWCVYLPAILLFHARTKAETYERRANAVRKFKRREARLGVRTVATLRIIGLSIMALGFVTILIAAVFLFSDDAIFPIALGIMAFGILIAVPFCYPAPRSFRLHEEKENHNNTSEHIP